MIKRVLGILLTVLTVGCGSPQDKASATRASHWEPWPMEAETFFVRDGQLFDKTGHWFVARGVNNPHNYYPGLAYTGLTRIKELGFNAVRIVWCADTLVRSGRCDPKDIHSLAELERVLAKLRSLELVGILNLQNATGSNDPADLVRLVDWYTRPDVRDLLVRYQDMLLLNIANEWHGSWDDPNHIYRRTYQSQIPRFRQAGLKHVLLVDARGWAQQFSSIPENYAAFRAIDPNILMSIHMFDQFGDPAKVTADIEAARAENIPLIIGEFSCSHYPGQPVACEAILDAAKNWDHPVGLMAWSFSGNGSPLEPLDVVSNKDWTTLSPFGKRIVHHPSGIKATAKTACIFPSAPCN